jgi:nitroimidazol reductase NimA-like FMN-containing flavoprotein (pyridoxamine 5'-phosphate oxidase superfamily)
MSVMAFGHIELLDDLDQATHAMQCMLDKYVTGYYEKPLSKTHLEKYRSSLGSGTLVFKLICSSMTAKENGEVPERMYDRAHYFKNNVRD